MFEAFAELFGSRDTEPKKESALSKWWNDDRHFIPRFWRDLTLNRVGLYTVTYDRATDCYEQSYVHIPKKDLPVRAVHVSGSGNSDYYLDNVQPDLYDAHYMTDDGQITKLECLNSAGDYAEPLTMNATDLYLYMINNDIAEALANKRRVPIILDTKTLGLIGVLIIAAVGFVLLRFVL